MKNPTRLLGGLVLLALLSINSQARVIVVTTTNNVSPPVGQTSLVAAIQSLSDGDTIHFNLSGTGPFFLESPTGGYPYITNNNVTIDGYSQPGAAPNTNSILAPNSAKLQIVLDARNQNVTAMQFEPGNSNDGYDETEFAILGVLRATNVTLRGLCLISKVPASADQGNLHIYGIAFARDPSATSAYGHVSGCWIGVLPDGKTLSGLRYPIAAYSYKDSTGTRHTIDNLTIGVAKNSTNAPAEFNVIVENSGMEIEGNGTRISGNFLGVLPDGVTEDDVTLNPLFSGDYGYGGAIEIGRGGNNTVIGTDGDGVNDANERNIIVGTISKSAANTLSAGDGYDHTIEFYGNNPGTNIVIAGNYIGVGIDGSTYFTNGTPAINAGGGSAQYRIGSNFDGVSDSVEGNYIVNNWPSSLFPASNWADATSLNFFDNIGTGTTVSARGNSLIDNFPFPVSPAKSDGGVQGAFLTNYYARALVSTTNGLAPVLSTNTTLARVLGTYPIATTNWPVTTIDIYAADDVGITNGQQAALLELPNGFVQGKALVASFNVKSAANLSKVAGEFSFDISGYEVKGDNISATANYSQGTNANAVTLTSPFAEPVPVTFVPGSIESVGLIRIVPDTPLIDQTDNSLGNWEPYSSVLGDSTFLIEGNVFATNDTANQRFVVYFQPAAGGKGVLGDSFFSDDGKPFRDQINLSRQNGNPGRVAGDTRPGAVNFLTAAETSAGQVTAFQSNSRWTNNPIYQLENRYVTVQSFSLNPTTLVQTPLTKAYDAIYGDLVTDTIPNAGNAPQLSRTGGTAVGLDNGNFAVVIDDKTGLATAANEVTTAAIVTPNGTIVKERFLVDPRDIWDNVAPFQGGFCVRVHNLLYFYDNAGNLKGQVDQSTTGEAYDTGRGDGTRIAGHVNSPFIYLAGTAAGTHVVKLSVFDARNQTFQAKADVSEAAFAGTPDRVMVAADALNRVTVVWVSQPAGYAKVQVAARVLAYNSATKALTNLTKSFFPFINAATNNVHTYQMTTAMTTRQIMVAAKGEINLENHPELDADSPTEFKFFTVFSHPNPQPDPTTPVGGAGPVLSVSLTGTALTISWPSSATGFTLESKSKLTDATWTTVGTQNPTIVTVASGQTFYRLRK